MKYHVTVRGRTYVVELNRSSVTIDGQRLETHWAAVPGMPLYHLLLQGESWTVAAQTLEAGVRGGGPGRWALSAAGERLEVEVQDERGRQIAALTGRDRTPAAAGGVVKAPMPGLVVRVLVSEGQLVAAGAGVVVVEAMKMENELRAPHAGVVSAVHVAAGDRVEKGAPLVTFAEPQS
ncbi:MAG: biotin/lipoyl-containing protein [Gemmatimonadales bacterium]